jgi:hypothetical protein
MSCWSNQRGVIKNIRYNKEKKQAKEPASLIAYQYAYRFDMCYVGKKYLQCVLFRPEITVPLFACSYRAEKAYTKTISPCDTYIFQKLILRMKYMWENTGKEPPI